MADLISTLQKGNNDKDKPDFKLIWLLYLVLGLFLIAVIAFATLRPILVLPRITLAPGFSFTDQNGQRLTNEDMRGKITLYNVTHTKCVDPCPETGLIMREVQSRLSEIDSGRIPVELVTISVDPDYDTPSMLRSYAHSLNADTDTWHFVTGSMDHLRLVIGGGFGLYLNKADDGKIIFDPGFMLVDGIGILRAEYRTAAPDADRILSDIELIANEVNKSEGPNKVAYEAAHLFMCYPR